MGMTRGGGPGGSALAIQISQTGWKDVIYLSIYLLSTLLSRHHCCLAVFVSVRACCVLSCELSKRQTWQADRIASKRYGAVNTASGSVNQA